MVCYMYMDILMSVCPTITCRMSEFCTPIDESRTTTRCEDDDDDDDDAVRRQTSSDACDFVLTYVHNA